jgi:sarcosine oxidase
LSIDEMTYDVAIAGLGGMGSAIAAHCATRGASVVGIEQFSPAHDRGSSHGRSRMIRKAYFEDPAYVPLIKRAYELWGELERATGENLLRITGVLSVGLEESEIIAGTKRAAGTHDLALQVLSRSEVERRYPMLRLQPDEVALFEPDAGVLDPERAVRAHLKVASDAGAQLDFGVTMKRWEPSRDGVEIHLDNGQTIRAKTLVLSLGAWVREFFESLGIPTRIQRNVQAWFFPSDDRYSAGNFPAFLLDRAGLPAPLYGFPDFGDGVKAAFHGAGAITDAQHLEREIDFAADVQPIVDEMDRWMPGAAATFRDATPCMYTLTPDTDFVIDRHPEHSNVVLCGGFSGHGFKFASVIGEMGADLTLAGQSRHDIGFLSLRRFRR